MIMTASTIAGLAAGLSVLLAASLASQAIASRSFRKGSITFLRLGAYRITFCRASSRKAVQS